MDSSRVKRIDSSRVFELDENIRVGSAFGFISEQGLKKSGLSWLTRRAGLEGPQVVPLVGDDPIDLIACTLEPLPLPRIRLESVTCDKALYREGADVAHLLVVAPLMAGRRRTLQLDLHGSEHSRYELALDASGCATVELRELPVGRYTAALAPSEGDEGGGATREDDDDDAPTCAFTVAEYKLAPLTASLLERRLDGNKLALRLRLESFGVALSGAIQLELLDDGTRIAKAREQAEDGELEVRFKLTGEGPHVVNVALVDDPSRTASVPIVGSRAAERKEVVVSHLGQEIHASLLPSSGSTEVRGVHLREGGTRTSPIHLQRVDTRSAKLTAHVTVRAPRLLVIDPCGPRRRADAVDPATAPHPQSESKLYRVASDKFAAGDYENALILFEAANEADDSLHPYYPYFIGCCLAKLERRAEAVAALRAALEQGFDDIEHMRGDDDLAALRGYASFDALFRPAVREIACPAVLEKGTTVPIAIDGPVALLAIGGYLAPKLRAWEGWAAVITPPAVSPVVAIPEVAEPGEPLTIGVRVEREGASVAEASAYVIVKDARLLSPDTPSNRLAAGIKRTLDGAAESLHTGRVTRKPSELPVPAPDPSLFAPPPMAMMFGGAAPSGAPMPMAPPSMAMPGMAMQRSAAVSMSASAPPEMMYAESSMSMDAPMALGMMDDAAFEGSDDDGGRGSGGADDDGSRSAQDEPEVLFAGLVALDDDGKGEVTLELPDIFADYICETFVLSGLEWAGAEARFRAAKDPFVSLSLAPFVRDGDGAIGTLHVGAANGPAELTLTRDGEPVALLRGDVPFDGAAIEGAFDKQNAVLKFLAGPGRFVATIKDAGGQTHRVEHEVTEPGKLRRFVRALRLLEAGQSVALSDDEEMISLRVLPSLDKPFKALVYATADYSHACCEQTAAKMLAAAAMYAMASNEGDHNSRKKAESIILAGVRREQKMFLPRRGFKMYPDSGDSTDTYWGPKAARYLFNVALLRDIKPAPSAALSKGIDECTRMAKDAATAYKLDWPPKKPQSCEQAFATLRFGDDKAAHERALQRARDFDLNKQPGGAVAQRAEAAYAAATLFRGGEPAHFKRALALTNAVVGALGEGGALYSTYDSVAAIALMAELVGAGVLSEGGGELEIDGEPIGGAEAVARGTSIQRVSCVEGVVAVEVARMREEDWEALDADVDLRVSLERDGRATRSLSPGDLVELVVEMPDGYTAGDLLWVCLPDALSAVEGGGQVKKRAFDFCGENRVSVPLTATAVTVDASGDSAPQHYAVCVRNMFEEERAGNPGPLSVTVVPGKGGGGDSLLGRAKAFFGKLAR